MDYEQELSNFSIARLQDEPRRVRAELTAVHTSRRKCAMSHYAAFIASAECVNGFVKECEELGGGVHQLASQTPRLSDAMAGLKDAAETYVNKFQNHKVIRRQMQTLAGIMEVPGLMYKCVWLGQYEDALQLLSFCKTLRETHPDVPVVQHVASQVDDTVGLLAQRISRDLRGDLNFHACFKLVSHLRRISWVPPELLPDHFLACRNQRLLAQLHRTHSESAKQHITRYLEVLRVNLLEIARTHTTIFGSTPDQQILASVSLSRWGLHRILDLRALLESRLREVQDGGMLRSIMDACVSMSEASCQFGLNFIDYLVPVFASVISFQFREGVGAAVDSLLYQIDIQKWPELAPETQPRSLVTPTPTPTHNDSVPTVSRPALHPPDRLMQVRPLAVFCNALLTALNHIRPCALMCVANDCSDAMVEAMGRVVAPLQQLFGVLSQIPVAPNLDLEGLQFFARTAAECLVPYLCQCFDATFALPPDASLHAHPSMGLTLTLLRDLYASALPQPRVITAKHPPVPIAIANESQFTGTNDGAIDTAVSDTSNVNGVAVEQHEALGTNGEGHSDLNEALLDVRPGQGAEPNPPDEHFRDQ